MVKLLLDFANKNNILLDLNGKNNENYPLSIAIQNNNLIIIQLLLEYANKNGNILVINEKDIDFDNISEIRAELNLLYKYDNDICIHMIYDEKNIKILTLLEYTHRNKTLVEYINNLGNIDINKEICWDKTLLYVKCENKDKDNDMVKFLIEHGVNVNKENKDGGTPLFFACENGDIDMVKFLVEHDADVNKENNNRETSLFFACKNGKNDVVKFFVKNKNIFIMYKKVKKNVFMIYEY